ncbi:MAG: hypothetical protein U9Q90_06520 [Campylobacterota bacterium]|nr:hypothetical protein [Campylobacterota bacterium]
MTKTILILLSLSALNISLFAEDMTEKIKMQNREVVKMAAAEMAAQLPQKVDNYTQLVDIKAKDESLVYTFEINTGAKSDDTVINEDKSRMKEAVTNGICQTSKRFLDSGILISYIYTSAASKKQLFHFDVNRKACEDLLGSRYKDQGRL